MAGLRAETFAGFRPLMAVGGMPPSQVRTNEDMNDPEMDSSDQGSNNGDIDEIDAEKLDASHREILEKLKRQEEEERKEIERELREAQREAIERARRHEEFRAQELRAQEQLRAEDLRTHGGDRSSPKEPSVRDSMPPQTEIRTQRPPGLLAQHGLTTKSHSDRDKDRERERDRLGDRLDSRPPSDFLSHHFGSPFGDNHFGVRSPPSSATTPPATTPGSGHGSESRPDSLAGSPSQPGHHWTFEEQFKQLYELSDDPKRKEFLDDLFAFMQKRGTPVNRIPIMAKQTLDLYELFRLVVSKGGLVEVINKKLWREITKGLNLPSSITSAAFTLRTQYMKYLYPYECEKLKLSSPAELQAAIDGNRREGRRPSYGFEGPFSVPTMIPTTPPHMNGGLLNGRPGMKSPTREMLGQWGVPPDWTAYWKSLAGTPDTDELAQAQSRHLRNMAERDAQAMEAATRAMEEATKRMEEASREGTTPVMPGSKRPSTPNGNRETSSASSTSGSIKSEEPPLKRPMSEEQRLMAHVGMPNAHIKITSRNPGLAQRHPALGPLGPAGPLIHNAANPTGDGRLEFDNSLVISMEINGIMYQGVLFAQHQRRI